MLCLDEKFLFWLSGFVDGEGCIFLRRLKLYGVYGSYQAGLRISNTNKDVLYYIQSKLGVGTVNACKSYNSKAKPNWVYGVFGREFLELCRLLVNNLKIKRLQAETVIEFYDNTFGYSLAGHPVPTDVLLQRDALVNRMTELNKKGILGTIRSNTSKIVISSVNRPSVEADWV